MIRQLTPQERVSIAKLFPEYNPHDRPVEPHSRRVEARKARPIDVDTLRETINANSCFDKLFSFLDPEQPVSLEVRAMKSADDDSCFDSLFPVGPMPTISETQ